MPLKSRTLVPPGGGGLWIFFEAKTNKSFASPTFDQLVAEVRAHRLANPRFAAQWTTDATALANEIDEYTCLRLNGDARWCASTNAPPGFTTGLFQRQQQAPAHQGERSVADGDIAAGAATLLQWFGEGATPVDRQTAETRAKICVECPHNAKGDWKRFFTVPAASTIQRTINLFRKEKIETSQDDKLNVCEVCSCPTGLKIHVPLKRILANMQPEVLAEFPEACWIKIEAKTKTS